MIELNKKIYMQSINDDKLDFKDEDSDVKKLKLSDM